jgi:anti-sigma factor RsiW
MNTAPVPGAARPVAPIDCETAVRRLWDFLDGRLPAIARVEVEAHLATCTLCPPHFDFARAMRRALADSAPVEARGPTGQDAVTELQERVRSALRRQALGDGARKLDDDRGHEDAGNGEP